MSRATFSLRVLCLSLASAILGGCPTSWRLERIEGERPTIHNDMWNEIRCAARSVSAAPADSPCARARAPLVHCAHDPTAASLCRSSPISREELDESQCASLSSIVAFAHLSDAQLKEHRVQIRGALTEAQYDGLVSGVMRNEQLERYDDAVLLATTLAINELADPTRLAGGFAPCPAPAPPLFAIHTGDAVDSGMFSELLQFIGAMDALTIPWLNVVGNHDILFFGTFPGEFVTGLNVVVPYVPIVDVDRFMRFHGLAGLEQDPSLPSPSARDADHLPSTRGRAASSTRKLRGTTYHGFDYACRPDDPKDGTGGLCTEARGYYAFDIPVAEPHEGRVRLRGVVLNTSEDAPATVNEANHSLSRGNVLPEQIRWLKEELASGGADTFFLVFGHHNLDAFEVKKEGEAIREALLHQPRVLGYFAGHTHVDAFAEHARPRGVPLVEVIAGSTLVFPQLARHVDVLAAPDGRIFVRVASLRQRLSDAGDVPSQDDGRCPALSEGTNFCHRLSKRVAQGRAGAFDDKGGDADWREEAAAIRGANALYLAYKP